MGRTVRDIPPSPLSVLYRYLRRFPTANLSQRRAFRRSHRLSELPVIGERWRVKWSVASTWEESIDLRDLATAESASRLHRQDRQLCRASPRFQQITDSIEPAGHMGTSS